MEIQPSNTSLQLTTASQLEPDSFNVTLASEDEKKELSKNQKRILSKLYRVGEKTSKTHSHFKFHQECIEEGITSKTTNFQKRGFLGDKRRLDNASKEVHEAAKEFFHDKLENEQKPQIEKLIAALWKMTTREEFDDLHDKWENSMAKREAALDIHREKKIRGLKKGPKKYLRMERREKEGEQEVYEAI